LKPRCEWIDDRGKDQRNEKEGDDVANQVQESAGQQKDGNLHNRDGRNRNHLRLAFRAVFLHTSLEI
jgi:hypothetical protein